MTSKRGLKDIINELFESSLTSSKFIQKIVQNITIVANESKKIADVLLTLNDKINYHEQLILKLINIQIENKDKLDYDIKSKNDISKPN